MNINLRSILDNPPMEFKQFKFRRLQASIPKRAMIYAELVLSQWECHNMKNRIQHIEDTSTHLDHGM